MCYPSFQSVLCRLLQTLMILAILMPPMRPCLAATWEEWATNEYPKALTALQREFSNVAISAVFSHRSNRGTGGAGETSGTLELIRSDGCTRLIATKDAGNYPGAGFVRVVNCYSPKYAFSLGTPAVNAPYSVTYFGTDSSRIKARTKPVELSIADCAYFAASRPVASLLALPSMQFMRATEESSTRQRRLVRLEFRNRAGFPDAVTYKTRAGTRRQLGRLMRSATLLVSPDENGVLYEYLLRYDSRTSSDSFVEGGSIEYEPQKEGSPLPVKAYHWTGTFDGTGSLQRETERTFVATSSALIRMPRDAFTLSAFGLPELPQSNPRNRTPYAAIWFFVGSSVFAILGIYVGRRARRFPLKPGSERASRECLA